MGKTKKLTPMILGLVLCISIIGAGAAIYYSMTKIGTVNIIINAYGIQLYEDDLLTTPMAEIDFGDAYFEQVAPVYVTGYLNAENPEVGKPIRVSWTCPDLPASMELTAQWRDGGIWEIWEFGTEPELTDVMPMVEVQFRLTIGSEPVGTPTFDIVIDGNDPV